MAFRHEVLHIRRQQQCLIDIPGAKILAHSSSLNQTRSKLNSDYSDRLLAMNMIVGTAARSEAAGKISAAPAPSPVPGAIEAHKAAWAAYGVEVENTDRLEAALPKD